MAEFFSSCSNDFSTCGFNYTVYMMIRYCYVNCFTRLKQDKNKKK